MEINGIITAMVTPFDQEQNLNLDAAFQLADRLIDHGVHGLFLLGSNGEFHVLSDEEKSNLQKQSSVMSTKEFPYTWVQVPVGPWKQFGWQKKWKR
jgi:Dihydrodipicolinate synthetase family.